MLTRIVNSLPLPTFVVNKQHKVTAWNAAIEALTGIPKSEIIGTDNHLRVFYTEKRPTLADLVVDTTPPEVIAKYYRGKCVRSSLIDGAYEATDFCCVVGTDGIWVRFAASPVKNEKGEIVGAIETLEDITERVRTEESLSRSEQRFRDLTETTPDIIWETDAAGKVTYFSPRIRDLLGYEPGQVIGKPATVLMTDALSSQALMSALNSRKPFWGLVFAKKHRDGHQVTFEGNGVPFSDAKGRFQGYRGVDRDITERKKAEGTLQESERSYRELFEVALDAIWVHDPAGRILKANEAMERLTGFSAEELNGGSVSLFMTDEGLHLAHDSRAHLLNGEAVVQPYEQRLVRKDSSQVDVMFSTGLIRRNDQVVAFQHIARDISEQKRLQRKLHYYLQQVTRAQEEERKRISRDLHDDTCQSLLLLIHGLDALLSQGDSEISRSLNQKLGRLHTLAVDIHGRLRRYAGDLRPAILDDLGLVAALEWIADNLMCHEGIKVITDFGAQAFDLPRESELVLFRIAQEALNNVKKHARASEVRIRLEAEADRATMTISDNGSGFELPPTLADFGGEGKLGLMGMQERAQLVGGTFSIQSGPEKGTVIIVEIPNRPLPQKRQGTPQEGL